MSSPERIYNLVLLGHGEVGKSSLISTAAFLAKAFNKFGTPELCDFEPEEKEKGTTLNAKVVPVIYRKSNKVNLIDTPGFFDLVGEILGGVFAADVALLVISSISGLEVGTEKSWITLQEDRPIPTFIVLNKFDLEGADFSKLLGAIQENLTPRALPIALPIGQGPDFKGLVDIINMKAWEFTNDGAKPTEIPSDLADQVESYREKLMEAAAESDEELLEKYLEEMTLSEEEFFKGLKGALLSRSLYPVIPVSALKPGSVKVMLDLILNIAPSASEVEIEVLKGEEKETLKPGEKLIARAFKTVIDPYIGKITYVRVFSGRIQQDQVVFNSEKGEKERITQLGTVFASEYKPAKEIATGDIGVIYKLEYTESGDTLTEVGSDYKLPPIPYPEPLFERALEPKTKADEEKLSTAINRTMQEDRTFKAYRDNEVKQFIIATLGDQHLDIILSKLKKRYKVNVDLKPRKVPYRETIKGKATGLGKYIKQSGGRGQYGVCHIEIEPLPRGEGFKFVDKIVGGVIPKNFIPSVEKGVLKAMEEGVLAGFKVIDVQVTLFDGKYHEVDSSDLAFQIAGSMAFKEAMSKANPVLLEPIVEVEVHIPDSFMGDIIGLLNSKRARIMGMEPSSRKGWQRIKALVPYAEMLDFPIELKSMTQGRGSFTMKFSHYEEAPPNVSQMIIAERQKERAEAST